jgi:hypothetical protein
LQQYMSMEDGKPQGNMAHGLIIERRNMKKLHSTDFNPGFQTPIQPAKRPCGRPRKNPQPQPELQPPKRRGRPPKKAAEAVAKFTEFFKKKMA